MFDAWQEVPEQRIDVLETKNLAVKSEIDRLEQRVRELEERGRPGSRPARDNGKSYPAFVQLHGLLRYSMKTSSPNRLSRR